MSGLPEDCHFVIFQQLTTEEKLLARGVCQEWRSVIEDLLSKQTSLSTNLPNAVRKGLYWSPCSGDGHKRSPSNTIGSKWKADDLYKLVSSYFRGLKTLFVYNVEFGLARDLITFMHMLRDLTNLEHLEFAFCSYSSPAFIILPAFSESLVVTPNLLHFAAVSSFHGSYHDILLKFLLTSVNSTNLTTITLDKRVALNCHEAVQVVIASNPADAFQIVGVPFLTNDVPNGQPPAMAQGLPRGHFTALRNFHQMISTIPKIKKLTRLDKWPLFSSNDSVKELTVNCLYRMHLFTGLTKANWINKQTASGFYAVACHVGALVQGVVQHGNFSTLLSPLVLNNLLSLRIGLMPISVNNLQFICNSLTNLEYLAIGSLDGILEDSGGKIRMDVNMNLDSELVQISNLKKLAHLELNFTGITDDNLFDLLEALKNLKTVALIGCYKLRAVDTILEGRELVVIRDSNILKNVHLTTKEEVENRQSQGRRFLSLSQCSAALAAEVIKFAKDPLCHWSIDTSEPLDMKATLIGPNATIYSELTFAVTIKLTKEYPNIPPEVMFTSDIFHPNIIRNKNVELDFMKKDKWTSAMSVEKVLNAIADMLVKPWLTFDKVINHEAAHLFQNDKQKFIRKTRQVFKFTYLPKLINGDDQM